MADIRIAGDTLIVEMEGLDKLWALKSRLEIPLANVRGATADPGVARERKGFRAPGTHLPGVITAGTFHLDGERVFWDVRDGSRAVVVELRDERYARLVVEVEDPRAAVALIESALAPSAG
ncbi:MULTISPECIES: hypothetical protein [Streptomyces]|uniref:Bacterial Pleckstrin homology domain-containing protein n=1 Tax=Streptomyces sudanensis TaxID=436397 RepID=A0ABY4TGV1_9ACTN|nr:MULTISPECIES: hypothetical protein [Streptomyces]MCP9956454.1 hypothetical protein [Streptomyces sudanensis]MCP9985658.1 hypothetical protein [Streptomyces sudanensis]MCQ0002933.1 hypothetical protein [Streptomyces sudanensis]URN17696.1 hypothetical protein MW084_19075 [Streptomyces sudanensis]